MQSYHVAARRLDAQASRAACKQAELTLDTSAAGRVDAFNPAELLLASLAACILKGTERMIPMLQLDLRGVAVTITGERQDAPPLMTRVTYEIVVDSDEPDHRLDLLHRNLRNYGTIQNTLAAAVEVQGTLRRKA